MGAPRPTIEAFLRHCARTGLDPVARQIYAIQRAGKWGIQVSIDGARLVAERSGAYRGQTAAQWTADGTAWVDVWLDKKPPAAARVGVYRDGFAEPMIAVATLDQYRPGGKAPMWDKMPALMLAKCAEMLALRKAFPQDLSGLYSAEEMDQAGKSERPAAPVPPLAEPVKQEVTVDWAAAAAACGTVEKLREVWGECQEKGELGLVIDGHSVQSILKSRAAEIEKAAAAAAAEPATAEPEDTPDVIEGELIEEEIF
jgi:phage recombination protein Bet